MEIPLLNDIVIIFGLAIIVLLICHKLHIPTVLGFLLTGIIVGPYGLGLVKDIHEVELLAEIGIVLLLFTIGIEFSLERLLQIRKSVLIGGPLQVILTFLATFFIARQFDLAAGRAVFMGFLVALSSTAIVLKLIQEKADVDSPHGRITLGILIFQDIIVVPMILITPLLAGASGKMDESLLILLAKGIGVILLVIVTAKWIVPKLLYQIAKTRDNEFFLLSMVVICFSIAWLTAQAGLSLALGAFLAGLIISESEYSQHALGNIHPFRDVFTTFFFVSIGMMLNVHFLFQQILFITIMTVGFVVLKVVISTIVTLLLGFPLRTGIMVGIALGQIGEFSFILSRVGIKYGLLTGDVYQQFLAIAILSMAATPFLIALAPRLADIILRLPLPKRLVSGTTPVASSSTINKEDHLIIVGYGVNGKNVAQAARAKGIPYVIIEMNPDTVRSERSKGETILYGDATYSTVLKKVNINKARIVVVAINDPTATRRITESIRGINSNVYLLVRTRYLQEMQPLLDLGADDVIPEEFETSVEIFARVLNKYLIPRDEIEKITNEIRANGYNMLRSLSQKSASLSDIKKYLSDVDINTFQIDPGSHLIGRSLIELNLRKRYSISIVAIRRDSQIMTNPNPDATLQANDILYILGSPAKISEAIKLNF